MVKTLDFLIEFMLALQGQLIRDEVKYKDTWLNLPRGGQEDRIWISIKGYFDNYFKHGEPIPWLKVAGNAFIAWIREAHPGLFPPGTVKEFKPINRKEETK